MPPRSRPAFVPDQPLRPLQEPSSEPHSGSAAATGAPSNPAHSSLPRSRLLLGAIAPPPPTSPITPRPAAAASSNPRGKQRARVCARPHSTASAGRAAYLASLFGCPEFVTAQQQGTDNEGYCSIIEYDGHTWGFNSGVPPISFCPWCGKRLPQNARGQAQPPGTGVDDRKTV